MSWEISVTVIVPDEAAATEDDAIDAVGEKLSPWSWAGQVKKTED